MSIIARFVAYAADFEKTLADDDWSRLAQYFSDDAIYRVESDLFGCELTGQEGIFAGISSGSVVYAAMRQAERMDEGNVVCLLADGGWKYLSTSLWTKDYEELAKESKGKIWW